METDLLMQPAIMVCCCPFVEWSFPLVRWCFGLVLLARWGFGLVQLIVVVVVAVSLVRWGFGLDAAGDDAVAAFESV